MEFVSFILTCVGVTVWIVWPESGLIAESRNRIQRRLPEYFKSVPDCYVCMGFWVGLASGIIWLIATMNILYIFGGFITSAVFWIFMNWPVMPEISDQATQPKIENIENGSPADSRLSICMDCDHFNGMICELRTGCKTSFDRFLKDPSSKCPENKF